MKKALKVITIVLIALVILIVLALWGFYTIMHAPGHYTCPFGIEREEREACYYTNLSTAANESNMSERISFLYSISGHYDHCYGEEVGKEFLEATYALCQYADMVPKEPDISLCSRIRSELGGPSLPMSEENKKAIEEYMARKKAHSKK